MSQNVPFLGYCQTPVTPPTGHKETFAIKIDNVESSTSSEISEIMLDDSMTTGGGINGNYIKRISIPENSMNNISNNSSGSSGSSSIGTHSSMHLTPLTPQCRVDLQLNNNDSLKSHSQGTDRGELYQFADDEKRSPTQNGNNSNNKNNEGNNEMNRLDTLNSDDIYETNCFHFGGASTRYPSRRESCFSLSIDLNSPMSDDDDDGDVDDDTGYFVYTGNFGYGDMNIDDASQHSIHNNNNNNNNGMDNMINTHNTNKENEITFDSLSISFSKTVTMNNIEAQMERIKTLKKQLLLQLSNIQEESSASSNVNSSSSNSYNAFQHVMSQ